ncbi:hypothetical protein HDU83_007402 [Entophlyctis luteolus]|nr:hypothetical protein HDU83_007402 [Entophlyctis luteolus]KAJ3378751.1 hypothetical protein HDU84_007327 [Entophlyctis sp. JEL0112]
MTEYFRRIDAMLAQHQMPPEYANSCSYVYCNDCEKKCYAKFHFLYHKCIFCKGYNTKILQTMEIKEGATLESLNEVISPVIAGPPGEPAASTGESEILREQSVQSIRHISSATPGFSTSNTSVLSAGTQLSVPPLTNAEVILENADRRRSRSASLDSASRMDISSHSSTTEE